jgi:hypothetical protein
MSQKELNMLRIFGTRTGHIVTLILSLFLALLTAGCNNNSKGESQPQAPISTSAFLTRAQENPLFSNLSSSGTGSVTVDPATRKISGVIVTNGIIGTQAHIHSGTPGVTGPVEIPLTGGPTIWTIPEGTVVTLDQLAKLNAGELYYNVHSARFPGGELRGQLNQQVRSAALSGANEAPAPIVSSATGSGILALDPLTRRVSGYVRTAGIAVVDPASPKRQAHVHLGAPGTAGSVIVPLQETSPGSGFWMVPTGAVLTLDQVAAFNAGNLYFNVHSEANPSGEIRGQIVQATLTVKTAQLTGAQETPPVDTAAAGTGIAVVNSITGEVFGSVKTTGIAGTLAHIHDGNAGTSGGVVVPLVETPAGSGVWLTAAFRTLPVSPTDELARFNAGGLYFNVHSAAHGSGEIRGQISNAGPVFALDGGTPPTVPVIPAPPQQGDVAFPSHGVSFSNHVQAIFDAYCIACHRTGGIAGFLPLTTGASYANLVDIPAVKPLLPGTRVIPGDSANSVLYRRIIEEGLPDQSLRMPQGGPFLDTLSPSAIPAIKAWIDEGAANN